MHAYAHQWACQLVYNPRIRESLGLTDGEGTERIWSRLRKVIGITRVSSVSLQLHRGAICTQLGLQKSRRIWLIDRLTASVGADMRNDLGDWIRRKLKSTDKFREEAKRKVVECGIPIPELRLHWKEQQKAQLSVRARKSSLPLLNC